MLLFVQGSQFLKLPRSAVKWFLCNHPSPEAVRQILPGEGGGLPVQVEGHIWVGLEDGRRNCRVHRAFQGFPHRLGLHPEGNGGEDGAALQYLADRGRYGLLRNIVRRGEPPLPHLLPSAGVVEGDQQKGLFRGKVGGGGR